MSPRSPLSRCAVIALVSLALLAAACSDSGSDETSEIEALAAENEALRAAIEEETLAEATAAPTESPTDAVAPTETPTPTPSEPAPPVDPDPPPAPTQPPPPTETPTPSETPIPTETPIGMVEVNIELGSFYVLEDCDGIGGKGDFALNAAPTGPGDTGNDPPTASVGTADEPRKLGSGGTEYIGRRFVYEVSADPDQRYDYRVEFWGHEYDFGLGGQTEDDALGRGRAASRTHNLDPGNPELGNGLFTLETGGKNCVIRLDYVYSARPIADE